MREEEHVPDESIIALILVLNIPFWYMLRHHQFSTIGRICVVQPYKMALELEDRSP
jgi:hypothetical protein